MEKVKVSKEVFDALENALKIQNVDRNVMLKLNLNRDFCGKRKILNDLSSIELAEILINGYELKKTPEEEMLELYKMAKVMTVVNGEYNYGYIDGMKVTLDKFGIKIKGIN